MLCVPLTLIKAEIIQVLHDRMVACQNLKTKVYTAARPAADSQMGSRALTAVKEAFAHKSF